MNLRNVESKVTLEAFIQAYQLLGYHQGQLQSALEQAYPEIMSKIQFELSPKPSKRKPQGAK